MQNLGVTTAWIVVAWFVLSLPLGIWVGSMLRRSAMAMTNVTDSVNAELQFLTRGLGPPPESGT